jgi:hypothetical protein
LGVLLSDSRILDSRSLSLPLLVFIFIASAQAQDAIGAQACATCHQEQHQEWSNARHSKMLQPAGPKSVLADFNRRQILLHNVAYRLRVANGVYFITAPIESTQPREYRVDYTLGSRRIQHYLTKLPDGRIVVLAPSWDVLRKEWFHNMDIVDPEEYSEKDLDKVQVWNKNCYSCHVSREEKNFDTASNTYNTRWQDFGTNCERCHGLGGDHARARQTQAANAPAMVVPTSLSASRANMVCAQCHSAREIVAEGFKAGSDYFDYFLPILEYGQKSSKDPAYWPDGRTRRFSNDAIGLWQSECYLKGGATCVNCHTDVHDPEIQKNAALKPGANAICTNCHAEIGKNVAQHSHHTEGSAGTACVDCHMPRTVFSIKAQIRDHSISIPVPDNTTAHGIPNACNQCHQDRDARWATAKMDEWYGPASRRKLENRAAAFTLARAGNRSAIDPLLAILRNMAQGSIARANAAGHLGRFGDDPRVLAQLKQSLTDPEALVRAVAAQRIPAQNMPDDVAAALAKALDDPLRSVRVGALLALTDAGKAPPGPSLDRAKNEYLNRTQIHLDFGSEQLNAGKVALLLDDVPTALRVLKNVPPGDQTYAEAQRLIAILSASQPSTNR